MRLYQRKGSPYWHYDFSERGERFRGSTGTASKREAERLAEELRVAARNNALPDGPVWTVKHLCSEYWSAHARDKASAATILGQLAALERILGGKTRLIDLTNATLMDYRARRRGEGLQPHSVNRELTILRAAMTRAHELHGVRLPKIAWRALRYPEPPPRQRFLSDEEWVRLMEAAHPDLLPILVCAVTTGLRKSNILEMDWGQVDMAARRIRVIVKGGKIHEVRINTTLAAALLPLAGERKGKVFATKNFAKRWRAAVEAAKLEDFRFHDLRHTFASWARQAGADIADVCEALGHSDVSMTMRYAHIKPDAKDTAFDRVGGRLMAQSTSHSKKKA